MNSKRALYSVVSTLGGVLAAGVLLIVIISGVPGTQAQTVPLAGAIRYVAPGANCGSAAPCYSTIQAAVDAALDGDEIRVAAGTYTDRGVRSRIDITTTGVVTQVVYINKAVAIRGGYTPADWVTAAPSINLTTVDAQANGRGIYIVGNMTALIEGLQIVGGNALGQGGAQMWDGTPKDAGGGIYILTATVTISGNTISGNNALTWDGGGLYGVGNSIVIKNNLITDNHAYLAAGVSFFGNHASIEGNTFSNNSSSAGNYYDGGGLSVAGSNIWVTRNTFTGNYAYGGGGLGIEGAVTVADNLIVNNSAVYGGGAFLDGGAVILSGNVITGNRASQAGGGLAMDGGQPTLTNNLIADNHLSWTGAYGSGVFVAGGSPRLFHNTLVANTGGNGSGVHIAPWGSRSTVVLSNNIIVSHTLGITVTTGSTATLTATLWGTGRWANGQDWGGAGAILTGAINLWGDPAFVDPATNNYHLTRSSAAIDQGIDVGVRDDREGDSRPQGCGLDIGADEVTGQVCSLPITGGTGRGPGYGITLPTGAFTDTIILTMTTLARDGLPALSPMLASLGNPFDLTLVYTSTAQPAQLVPGQTYTLTTSYAEGNLGEVVESTLALYYWDGSQWKKETTSVLDSVAHTVVATPNHFSIWALLGDRPSKLYLPLILR